VKARGALPALLLAVGSIAATCHASPPEPPPAPSATAPSASPPEPVTLAPDAAVAPDAALAPDAAPAAKAARPPDPLAIARRAWEERMRLPLLSDDARLVATNPGVDPKDGSRVILLKVVEVDSDHDRQMVTVRVDDPPDVELARLAEAAAVLDGRTWSTLTPYPKSAERYNDLGVTLEMEATGDGLVVQFHEPTLTVREVVGRTLFQRAFPHWSVGKKRDCAYSTYVLEVWGSRRLGVLLVSLGHNGFPFFCGLLDSMRTVRFAPRSR
jgi:hypothetical protein